MGESPSVQTDKKARGLSTVKADEPYSVSPVP